MIPGNVWTPTVSPKRRTIRVGLACNGLCGPSTLTVNLRNGRNSDRAEDEGCHYAGDKKRTATRPSLQLAPGKRGGCLPFGEARGGDFALSEIPHPCRGLFPAAKIRIFMDSARGGAAMAAEDYRPRRRPMRRIRPMVLPALTALAFVLEVTTS